MNYSTLDKITIKCVDNEPVRIFFERYTAIQPLSHPYPYRYEMEEWYSHFYQMTLPVLDLNQIDDAVEWCVYNVDAIHWFNRAMTFYFTNECDAAFFRLSFATLPVDN